MKLHVLLFILTMHTFFAHSMDTVMDTVQKQAENGDVPAIITHIENLASDKNYEEAAKWYYIAAIRVEGDCACWQAPEDTKEFFKKKIFCDHLRLLFAIPKLKFHKTDEDQRVRSLAQNWFAGYSGELPKPFWVKEYYLKILGVPLYIACSYKNFEPESEWKQLRETAQKKYAPK